MAKIALTYKEQYRGNGEYDNEDVDEEVVSHHVVHEAVLLFAALLLPDSASGVNEAPDD